MFPLRSENALLNRIGRTRTRRRNVIFTIITNSLSFIFRCFFDYLSSAFPMMHRRCGRLMVQSQPHSSPPCVHNFSANIFAFSSFLFCRKLSQIIISNFWGAFRCFQRIATLSMFGQSSHRATFPPHFNDHYSEVCYDAGRFFFGAV